MNHSNYDSSLRIKHDDECVVELTKGEAVITQFDLSGPKKTMGLLLRGPDVPPKLTESGWARYYDNHPDCETIQRSNYTNIGLEICKAEGFELPKHGFDRGIRGRFYSCLAEMQLINWYVKHHLISAQEVRQYPALASLKGIEPPWRCPLVILISGKEYITCKKYANHLEERYNIKVTIKSK